MFRLLLLARAVSGGRAPYRDVHVVRVLVGRCDLETRKVPIKWPGVRRGRRASEAMLRGHGFRGAEGVEKGCRLGPKPLGSLEDGTAHRAMVYIKSLTAPEAKEVGGGDGGYGEEQVRAVVKMRRLLDRWSWV